MEAIDRVVKVEKDEEFLVFTMRSGDKYAVNQFGQCRDFNSGRLVQDKTLLAELDAVQWLRARGRWNPGEREVMRPQQWVPAMLFTLPEPWKLIHGPVPVILEFWNEEVEDETPIQAVLPLPYCSGAGSGPTEALRELQKSLIELYEQLESNEDRLAGTLSEEWKGLQALMRRTE